MAVNCNIVQIRFQDLCVCVCVFFKVSWELICQHTWTSPRHKPQVHISGLSFTGFNRCARHHCASRSQRKWRRINVTHQWFTSGVITGLSSLKFGAIVKCGQKTFRLCWPRKALFAWWLWAEPCCFVLKLGRMCIEYKKKKADVPVGF